MTIDKTAMILPEDQYYKEEHPKQQIYIHHTVGGSALSTYKWWLQDPLRIGTAFIIERDGVVYQTFEPKYWAHHLGLKSADNTLLNKTSIGIELASEGPLTYKAGSFYAFDGTQKFKGKELVELIGPWRGYSYFDAYDLKQILSCFELIELLCRQFNIPKQLLPESKRFITLEENKNFKGILGHCEVRSDKTDPHKFFPWNELERFLNTLEIIPERLKLYNRTIE